MSKLRCKIDDCEGPNPRYWLRLSGNRRNQIAHCNHEVENILDATQRGLLKDKLGAVCGSNFSLECLPNVDDELNGRWYLVDTYNTSIYCEFEGTNQETAFSELTICIDRFIEMLTTTIVPISDALVSLGNGLLDLPLTRLFGNFRRCSKSLLKEGYLTLNALKLLDNRVVFWMSVSPRVDCVNIEEKVCGYYIGANSDVLAVTFDKMWEEWESRVYRNKTREILSAVVELYLLGKPNGPVIRNCVRY